MQIARAIMFHARIPAPWEVEAFEKVSAIDIDERWEFTGRWKRRETTSARQAGDSGVNSEHIESSRERTALPWRPKPRKSNGCQLSNSFLVHANKVSPMFAITRNYSSNIFSTFHWVCLHTHEHTSLGILLQPIRQTGSSRPSRMAEMFHSISVFGYNFSKLAFLELPRAFLIHYSCLNNAEATFQKF